VALVDPSLPADDQGALTCPQCRGRLGRPRISPSELPEEPPAASRVRPGPVRHTPVPSNALVGLTIAGLFLLLLFGFFVFMLVTPHTHYWQYLTK